MDYRLLLVLNTMTSLAIVWMCLCRLNVSSKAVHAYVRAHYAFMLTAALANAFQTILFAQLPTLGGFLVTLCVAVGMAVGRNRWRRGPPRSARIPVRKFGVR